MSVGGYVPVKDQCWIKACHTLATKAIVWRGVNRKVCPKHEREFGQSKEKGS